MPTLGTLTGLLMNVYTGAGNQLDPYATAVMALQPVSYWGFDNGAGVNTVAGAPSGTVSNASSITGVNGEALDMSGTSAEVYVAADASNSNFAAANQYLTFEMIIKFPSALPGAGGVLMSKGPSSGTNNGWVLERRADGNVVLNIYRNGNWQRFASSAPPTRGQWIHLAISMRSGDYTASEQMWVDGQPIATTHESTAGGTVSDDSAYPLVIGQQYLDGTPPAQWPHDFELDSMAVYKKALSDAEVLANYNVSGIA